MTRVIALMNQKGGVGKTTSTVNLGAALARAGQRVLLIDLDPQAHLTLSVGLDPETLDLSLYDLLTREDLSALDIVCRLDPGEQAGSGVTLGVLPAEVNLAGVESELAEGVADGRAQTILRQRCGGLIDSFDFVLLDCPPSLGLLTVNALALAREVIVPMQAHYLALQGLGKLFETVHLLAGSAQSPGLNPSLRVAGVVLCMHEKQTVLAGDVVSDIQQFLDAARGSDLPWARARIYEPPIRRNIKLAEAPSFGKHIFEYDAQCHGARDYEALARSVIADPNPRPGTELAPAAERVGEWGRESPSGPRTGPGDEPRPSEF